MSKIEKSKCCNAKMIVRGSEDFGGDYGKEGTTNHYECVKCRKPCDPKNGSEITRDKIAESNQKVFGGKNNPYGEITFEIPKIEGEKTLGKCSACGYEYKAGVYTHQCCASTTFIPTEIEGEIEKKKGVDRYCSVSPSCLICEHLNREESYCEYFDAFVSVDSIISQAKSNTIKEIEGWVEKDIIKKNNNFPKYDPIAQGWAQGEIDTLKMFLLKLKKVRGELGEI